MLTAPLEATVPEPAPVRELAAAGAGPVLHYAGFEAAAARAARMARVEALEPS